MSDALIARLTEQIATLQARIDAVLELHQQDSDDPDRCRCGLPFPCTTRTEASGYG